LLFRLIFACPHTARAQDFVDFMKGRNSSQLQLETAIDELELVLGKQEKLARDIRNLADDLDRVTYEKKKIDCAAERLQATIDQLLARQDAAH
jgi:hypothetical protein